MRRQTHTIFKKPTKPAYFHVSDTYGTAGKTLCPNTSWNSDRPKKERERERERERENLHFSLTIILRK